MFKTDLRPGEGVDIDDGRIIVRLEQKSGQVARIAIDTPAGHVPIKRLESVSTAHLARQGLTKQ